MRDQQGQREQSPFMMPVYLLLYAVLLAIPTVLLAMRFPDAAIWLVFGALLLFFAGPAFVIGMEWDDPRYTPQVRQAVKAMMLIPVVTVLADAIADSADEGLSAILQGSVFAASLVATMLVFFYLGVHFRSRSPRQESES